MSAGDHRRAEIAVIGSGAGGAATAAALAEAGRDVVVLEEGPWVDADRYEPFSLGEMVAKYRSRSASATLGVPPVAYVEGRCAGGGTEINSGLYHRTPPEVLDTWRRTYAIADLDPADLEPYAKAVETALSISTVPGEVPARSAVLARGAAALGWDAVEVPRWVKYDDPALGWRGGVKQTMTRTYLPRARAAGAELVLGCRVDRLRVEGGRVREVVGSSTDSAGRVAPLHVRADHVFVCGGAIQTPFLLRRSGFRGRIGRNLKMHPTIKLAGLFEDRFDDQVEIPMHQVKEFAPDLTLGGSVSRPGYVALALGDDWTRNRHDIDRWEQIAVYYAAIRSDGAGRVRDVPGIDAPIVSYRLDESDISRLARGCQRLGELLFAAGATRLYASVSDAPAYEHPRDLARIVSDVARSRVNVMTIHLFSTVGMGERRGVTGADSFGRVWGVSNLYVNDGSLLPDAPGVNPQGTIMALALRNCDRFLGGR